MKWCWKCKRDLSEDCFGKNRGKPDGLSCSCKECKAIEDKEYRERHKDKYVAMKAAYYVANREATIARTSQYAKDNKEQHRAWGKKSKEKNKREVLSHYCGGGEPRCKCGVTDLEVLTIDHINGDGAEHRRRLGKGASFGGSRFYFWLKLNGYPEGFQVLCFNCQYRKRAVEMRAENPTHLQEVRAAYARSVKLECLDHYGGRACSCGETDIVTLTLDHVNDDGAKDRRESGLRGFGWYVNLRKQGFPNDPPLQVLCLNCQIKKRQRKYEKGKVGSTADSDGAAIVV